MLAAAKSKRLVLFVSLLSLGGMALWLALYRDDAGQVAVMPADREDTAAGLTASNLTQPRVTLETAPGPQNAEEFLADYWGADWPRIEAELRKQDGWADYDLKKLPMLMPLEEAMPLLRERLSWGASHLRQVESQYLEVGLGSGRLEDRAWIQTKYGHGLTLGDAEFATIEAELGPVQARLLESAQRITKAIEEARFRLFDQRDCPLYPYSSAGVHARDRRVNQSGGIDLKSASYEGWCTSVIVLESDVPNWKELREENLALTYERNRQLKAVLDRFR